MTTGSSLSCLNVDAVSIPFRNTSLGDMPYTKEEEEEDGGAKKKSGERRVPPSI